MTRTYPIRPGDVPDDDIDAAVGDDKSWRWVAAVAAVILVAAVAATIIILNDTDSGDAARRVTPPAGRSAAPPPPPSATTPPPTAPPSQTLATTTPSAGAAPPSADAAPADARTIVYTITGVRAPDDLVSVTYTDEQGSLRTDVNVTLPWSRTVVLEPGVELNSVTATSFASQLNCTISDAAGAVVASQSFNTIAATCNR